MKGKEIARIETLEIYMIIEDGSQKRARSPSVDSRQLKRQKPQQDEKRVSSSTDDRQKRPDSQSDKRGTHG